MGMKELIGYSLIFVIIIAALGGFVYVARGFLKGWGGGTISKTGKVTGGSVVKGSIFSMQRISAYGLGFILAAFFLAVVDQLVILIFGIKTPAPANPLIGLALTISFGQGLMKYFYKDSKRIEQ